MAASSSSPELEAAIQETKDVLQPLFTKPKLSSKLLSKPPFRFLHDIILATIRSTGFPNGYFSLDELDSSNFKESKSAKVAFLNKFISLVNVGHGSAFEGSSTKIVAGLQPVSTNVLLARFGRLALDESIARTELIQHCLSGKGIDEFNPTKADVNVTADGDHMPDDRLGEGETEVTNSLATSEESVMEQIKSCNDNLEQTKAMISSIVTKPKCSDKLLSKPPFRFLHDLITAIGQATQFDLGQIFTESELVSSNVKEKGDKIEFLQKLVSFLERNLEGMSINVKPSKVISGLEPERTRYLLQIFTVVATTKCVVCAGTDEPPEENAVEAEPRKDFAKAEKEEATVVNMDEEAKSEEAAVPKPAVPTVPPSLMQRPATSRGGRSIPTSATMNDKPNVMRPSTAIARPREEKCSIFQMIAKDQKKLNKPRAEEVLAVGADAAKDQSKSELFPPVEKLPAKMLDVDFGFLAESLRSFGESMAPFRVSSIDVETLLQERSRWIAEQRGMQDDWLDLQEKCRHLAPLRAKLRLLEANVQEKVARIKKLEEIVQRNDQILRSHGVTHAY